ncbi:MAG TPA: hypothetical protein VNI01_03150, partial [Elusimicrobiota bacterium]|nr:hypothetical protein [Elusimicrobiota bacterium]
MRFALASAFFLLLSACGPKTQVMTEDAVQFQTYHRLGVRAFLDKTGRGQAIADALDSKLQKAFYEPVDEKLLAKLLEQYKPDRENGFSV